MDEAREPKVRYELLINDQHYAYFESMKDLDRVARVIPVKVIKGFDGNPRPIRAEVVEVITITTKKKYDLEKGIII